MAKEPINTLNRTPSVPPRNVVNINAIDKSTLKPILPNRISGGENVSTKDGKFNMAQLQKFEYFSKTNIVPNKTLRNSEDWQEYKNFLNMDKTEKGNVASEYSAWKKAEEEKQAIEISDNAQDQTHENIQEKTESENAPQTSSANLSVEDKIKMLEAQDKFGILSVDDRNTLDNLKKSTEKGESDEDIPTVKRDDKSDHDPDELKNGPFKEGDIIDFMYNDWLIAGANYLYIKSDKYSRKYGREMYDSFKNQLKKKKAEKEDSKSAKTTETRDFEVNTDVKLANDLDKKHENIDKNKEILVKRFKLISEGKYDEAKVSKNLKKQLEIAGKDNVKKFCETSIERFEDMSNNYKMIQNISTTIVSAEVNMEKANNAKTKNPSKKTLRARQEEIANTITSRMNEIATEGGDPVAFLNNAYANAKSAQAFTSDQIEKDNVNEFGKKDIENKALTDCLKFIKNKDEKEQEPNTLIEALNGNFKIDENLSKSMEKANLERAGLKYRSEDLDQRRDRIKELREKLGDKMGGKDSVLNITRHSDGSAKTSSVVLVDELAESKRKDQTSGSPKQSKETQIIVNELNKNKSK